jgi:hypothetical protein
LPKPITFAHLVRIMRFNDISFVPSPPAPSGRPYFIGSSKSEAFFPYISGPVKYLDREYENDELIPVKLSHSLAKHLKIDREMFWRDAEALENATELIPVRVSAPQKPN